MLWKGMKTMMTKPFTIALILSLSFNVLFGYLSYSFYADKQVAEQSLKAATDANKSLEDALVKKETACKVTDVIVSEYTKEKQEIVRETDGVLDDIDKLPSMPVQVESKPKRQDNAKEQTKDAPVSLDGRLGDDIKRVLSQSCHSSKGSNCD